MEFLSMVHALLGDHLYDLGTIDDIKLKKAVDSLDGRRACREILTSWTAGQSPTMWSLTGAGLADLCESLVTQDIL